MILSLTKTLSLFLSFCLFLEQSVFAQAIDLSHYFANSGKAVIQGDKFRPLHLRYISYDTKTNDFQILLDKGGAAGNGLKPFPTLEDETQELMKYFFIGLSLPNEKFWVNLRPDSPDNILDPDLEKTDIGRIFLEADLQLKKDTSGMTSPQTPEGKAYWDKLYKKAGELFGSQNITIPTITRPWIVPGEIIIGESSEGAYIYKATLKVMLEEDYLRRGGFEPAPTSYGSRTAPTYQQSVFSDPRLKELNQYSTQLIKESIIPKLTYEVNTSKRYAPLRQVYYSLILAQWFKQKYGRLGSVSASDIRASADTYINLIDSNDLANLTSKEPYDKQAYFRQYQKSFKEGEYNLQEPIYTPTGQNIRRYMSGGLQLNSSPITRIETGKSINIRPYLISVGSPITDAFMKKQAEILFQSLLSLHKEIMKASPEHKNTILEGWSFRIKDAIAAAAGLEEEEKVLLGKIIHDATPSAHKHEYIAIAESIAAKNGSPGQGQKRIQLVVDIVKEAQKSIQNNNIFGNDEKNTVRKIFLKVHNLASSSIDIDQRLLSSSSAAAEQPENPAMFETSNGIKYKIIGDFGPVYTDVKIVIALDGKEMVIKPARNRDGQEPEIGLAKKLKHPGIVIGEPIQDKEGNKFLLMPYIKGDTLEDFANRKEVPLKDKLHRFSEIVSDLTEILAYFQKSKFSYNDSRFSPQFDRHFIIEGTTGRLKLIDFEQVRELSDSYLRLLHNAIVLIDTVDLLKSSLPIPLQNKFEQELGKLYGKIRDIRDIDEVKNNESENLEQLYKLYGGLKVLINKFGRDPAVKTPREVNSSADSPATISEKGGIDFHALPIETRQIDSLQSLADSPLAVNPNLNFEEEWRGIQMVFNAGIRPSARRMAEFAVSASASPLNSRRLEDLRGLVTDLLRRDEEDEKPAPADPALKELLAIL